MSSHEAPRPPPRHFWSSVISTAFLCTLLYLCNCSDVVFGVSAQLLAGDRDFRSAARTTAWWRQPALKAALPNAGSLLWDDETGLRTSTVC